MSELDISKTPAPLPAL